MPHDKKTTIHISHYSGSPTWRSAVSPENRAWLLFVDQTGAPHLYLATETQDSDGHTVTTYVPCVRAMLRAEAEAGAPMLPGVDGAFAVRIYRTTDPDQHVAVIGDDHATGSTRNDAVLGVLAKVSVASFTIDVSPQGGAHPWLARASGQLGRVGATLYEAVMGAIEEVERAAEGTCETNAPRGNVQGFAISVVRNEHGYRAQCGTEWVEDVTARAAVVALLRVRGQVDPLRDPSVAL